MKEVMRTYETRCLVDELTDSALTKFAELFARVEHKLLAAYCSGKKITDLKSSHIDTYQITARHFNAIRSGLEGKIASRIEHQKLQKDDLTHKIAYLEKEIKKKKAPRVQHQKNRRLALLKEKLEQLTSDIKEGKVPITFGSNKLFRAQFALKENGYANHAEWKTDWEVARTSQIFFIGSKDETSGNQSCTLFSKEDGSFDLRVRLPDALKLGKYVTLSNIVFNYGQTDLIQALKQKGAISWRFLKDKKGWRLFASISLPKKETLSLDAAGVVAIDINVDHIALVELDRNGNLIHKETHQFLSQDKSKHQTRAQIGDVSKNIVEYAKQKKKPLVIEKLEFTKKRASLRQQGHKLARKLSSFTYSSICTHIHARANKEQVKVCEVNPAYTSQIGKVKFSHRYGLSIHHGAALAIGRRYLGFSEKPNSGPGIIPDGKGGHVTLSLPVRNRDEHVWRFWSKLSKKIPAALTAHFLAAKQRSMSTLITARMTEPPPKVKGEIPLCESLEALLV